MFNFPFEVPETEPISKELSGNEKFNSALKSINRKLVNESVKILRSTQIKLNKVNSCANECEFEMLIRCRNFSLLALFNHIDEVGLSSSLIGVAPTLFEAIDFSSNKNFQQIEYLISRNYGLTRESISDICKLVDQNKDEFKFMVRNAPSKAVFTPILNLAISEDPTSTQGPAGAGTVLAGVNTAFLVAPEPLISKGVGAASILTGIAANLFD